MTPGSPWLRVLAATNPELRELEEHRAEMLRAATSDEARQVIEADAEHARSIHARLAERAQTARELYVLNDLARRLAGLHETANVLQEVTSKSRQLLSVDIAFILLRTDDGVLRIEFTDGSLGAALRGAEMREGEGLGGAVLKTGQPMWSENYLLDKRIRRVESVDMAAASEQLGGVLAVPLRAGDEALGVLLVGDRRPRRFAAREMELLAAMASHAAVALRNAALFESNMDALEQLRHKNELLSLTIDQRLRATELREALSELVVQGAHIADLADEVADSIGASVAVLDATGAALSKGGPAGNSLTAAPITQSFFEGDRSRTGTLDGVQYAATTIALHDGYAGCLVASTDTPLPEDALRLLEIGATSVALVMTSQRAVAEAELRSRDEFLHALVTPDIDEGSVRRRALAAGIDLDVVRSVLVFDPGDHDGRASGREASQIASKLKGWVASHSGMSVVLVPNLDSTATKLQLVSGASAPLAAAVGVATCEGGVAGVRSSYQTARQTASLLHALDRPQACATAEQLGPFRAVLGHVGRQEVGAYVSDQIGPLLEHDRANNRELTQTVATFLHHAQNHRHTAAALHIHPNTLYQRLERVTQLLGPDWRDPDRVLDLLLALRFQRLQAAFED